MCALVTGVQTCALPIFVARWLAADPEILLLNDPTRGIDIGAKRDLYALFAELADKGMAIVMLSTEVDEHLELMDRVLVFRDHRISSTFTRDELTRESLVESRSEEHTSELQSLMRISYAVFCLKKKTKEQQQLKK